MAKSTVKSNIEETEGRQAPSEVFKPFEHFALLGVPITAMCLNYIITGKVKGVLYKQPGDCLPEVILLEKCSIVYETGAFTERQWKDAQLLPYDWYLRLDCIESFGQMK